MAAGEGFKQATFGGFDKNEVNAYINNLSKKISSLELDLQSKDEDIRAAKNSAEEANRRYGALESESKAKIEELNKQLLEERHNVINLKKEADILKAKLAKAEKAANSLGSAAQRATTAAKANADAKAIMDKANAEIKAKCDKASAEIKSWIEKANADVRTKVDKANAELKVRAEKADKEAAAKLEQAEKTAAARIRQAEKDAAAKIEQAETQSKLSAEKAEQNAKAKLETAGKEADSRIKSAENEAAKKLKKAEAEAEELLNQAGKEASKIQSDAKAKAEKIISDAQAVKEANIAVVRKIKAQLETIATECGTLNDMAGKLIESGADTDFLPTEKEVDFKEENKPENENVFSFAPEMPNMPNIHDISTLYKNGSETEDKNDDNSAANVRNLDGSIPLDEIWDSGMLPNENGGFSIDMEPEQNNYPEQNGDSTDNDENFGTGDDILPLDSEEALFDMGFSSELLEQTTPKSAINKDDFDGDILSSLEDANREFSVKPSEETENFERADNNISEVDSSSEPGDPWSELQRQLEEMEKSGNFPGAF